MLHYHVTSKTKASTAVSWKIDIQSLIQSVSPPVLTNVQRKLMKPTTNFIKKMKQSHCLSLMTGTQTPWMSWYIPPTHSTVPSLHNTHRLKSCVSCSNFNAPSWNICKTSTENQGLGISQEVKEQFIELSIVITSELWRTLRVRGSEPIAFPPQTLHWWNHEPAESQQFLKVRYIQSCSALAW